MGIRYYFKDEVIARQAVAKAHNHQFWAHTFKGGLPAGAACGVECSSLCEGLFEEEFGFNLL